MARNDWEEMRMPQSEDSVWDLYHENSKTSHFELHEGDAAIARKMRRFYPTLSFEDRPFLALPTEVAPLGIRLDLAMKGRMTTHGMSPCSLPMKHAATILHYGYGNIRKNEEQGSVPVGFKASPSAGALYPLELYCYSQCVEGMTTGLYHYDSVRHGLAIVRAGDARELLGRSMIQTSIPYECSILVFVTAVFERSIFKYGDRGYRFVLLEAGHVAQNIDLVAIGLGLGSINIGGFFDRRVDEFLGIDGCAHSALYIVGIGSHEGSKRV